MSTDETTCRQALELLPGYLDGALGPEEARQVEHHAATCQVCHRFMRAYQAVPRVCRGATDAELPAQAADDIAKLLAGLK